MRLLNAVSRSEEEGESGHCPFVGARIAHSCKGEWSSGCDSEGRKFSHQLVLQLGLSSSGDDVF